MLAVALLAGCTIFTPDDTADPVASSRVVPDQTGIALTAGVGRLSTASTQPQPARLATGLIPPTNRWFSGLVFGAAAQPVFPLPLSFSPRPHGFVIGLPAVTATADTIFGSASAGLGLLVPGAGMRVVRYDDLTVTARWGAADVTLAQGWPYVAVLATRTLDATLTAPVAATVGADATATVGAVATATIGGVRYAVRAPAGSISGTRLRLQAGERAVLFALPDGVADQALIAGSRGIVTGGSVTRSVGAATASTRLTYRTTGGATLLAALPHQQHGGAGCSAGTVASAYGPMSLCTGTVLRFAVPRTRASDSIAFGTASRAARAALRAQLARDVAATPAEPADTYGGGKWLYRLANLLQVARAVDDPGAAATIRHRLDVALTAWATTGACAAGATHCFVVDPVIHGIVGREASYGSDQFNDHQFHYGYFLYAAAVAVTDRPSLRSRIEPVVDLLAADIAAPSTAAGLPAMRMFDAYAGHSWASGYSPFADGNNEESSSEAVNAWNGLSLWAAAIGDEPLATEAAWLLSNEAATAKAYWLQPDLTAFPEFRHSFVSLNWGGKRDSATWFSADPAAKLGIQLIPMNPAAGYLTGPATRMTANLTEARSAHTGLFADYLLLYSVLAGRPKSAALRQLAALPAAQVDSADSKSYAAAWILSR